jgi:hypothetical protein
MSRRRQRRAGGTAGAAAPPPLAASPAGPAPAPEPPHTGVAHAAASAAERAPRRGKLFVAAACCVATVIITIILLHFTNYSDLLHAITTALHMQGAACDSSVSLVCLGPSAAYALRVISPLPLAVRAISWFCDAALRMLQPAPLAAAFAAVFYRRGRRALSTALLILTCLLLAASYGSVVWTFITHALDSTLYLRDADCATAHALPKPGPSAACALRVTPLLLAAEIAAWVCAQPEFAVLSFFMKGCAWCASLGVFCGVGHLIVSFVTADCEPLSWEPLPQPPAPPPVFVEAPKRPRGNRGKGSTAGHVEARLEQRQEARIDRFAALYDPEEAERRAFDRALRIVTIDDMLPSDDPDKLDYKARIEAYKNVVETMAAVQARAAGKPLTGPTAAMRELAARDEGRWFQDDDEEDDDDVPTTWELAGLGLGYTDDEWDDGDDGVYDDASLSQFDLPDVR